MIPYEGENMDKPASSSKRFTLDKCTIHLQHTQHLARRALFGVIAHPRFDPRDLTDKARLPAHKVGRVVPGRDEDAQGQAFAVSGARRDIERVGTVEAALKDGLMELIVQIEHGASRSARPRSRRARL